MSSLDPDEAEEAVYRSMLMPSYAISLCVSAGALVLLVFTLWIFLRQRDATAGARGMVLLIVTGLFAAASLTVLHLVNIGSLAAGNSSAAATAAAASAVRVPEAFLQAQYVITNTSLLLRNWWVTFLTVVRFVVILFPLRVPEMLTRRRQLVAFFAILTTSAAISIVRYLEEKTCTAHAATAAAVAPGESSGNSTAASDAYPGASCESFIIFFFVMQTGIPVPAVLVLSVALAVHLCAAREPADDAASAASPGRLTNRRSESIASSSNKGLEVLTAGKQPKTRSRPAANSRIGRYRRRKATRILLALAATFTVLELPTLVYFIMLHFFPHFRCTSPGKERLIFSGLNALVTLDTLANFFIFFVFSESFKREVERCACRGGQKHTGGRQLPDRGLLTVRARTSDGDGGCPEMQPLRLAAEASGCSGAAADLSS